MYHALLVLHFLGISIGAGTGIYLFALTYFATHNLEQAEVRTLLPGVVGAISLVGNLGLLLLIVSGGAMAAIVGEAVLTPLFMLKMLLVSLIVVFVVSMNYLVIRSRRSSGHWAARLMQNLKPMGPLLGISTVTVAVLEFH